MRPAGIFSAPFILLAASWAGAAAQTGTPPGPGERSIKKEVVKVRLVTLDVAVFDRDDRTAPDLQASDFELFVDGRRTAIDTFDPACAAGALEVPRAGWTGRWSEPGAAGAEPRRVIFVFDYLHLSQVKSTDGTLLRAPYLAIRQLTRTLRELPGAREEIMIAVLDGGLRVEQPFTASRERTLETLARMEKDVTLYAGHFEHVTESPLFAGLSALIDLVDTIPGSKAAVIFTGGQGPGNAYDREYRALGNHAGLARVAFYPVDCSGLQAGEFTAYAFR
jgi:VWFA-related protein